MASPRRAGLTFCLILVLRDTQAMHQPTRIEGPKQTAASADQNRAGECEINSHGLGVKGRGDASKVATKASDSPHSGTHRVVSYKRTATPWTERVSLR